MIALNTKPTREPSITRNIHRGPLQCARVAALAALILAYMGSGCAKGEQVVVLYRGGSTLDVHGAVVKGEHTIGYIESVQRASGVQRATLRVKRAAEVSHGDRFLPNRFENRVGLKVIAGGREPMTAGAEMEAGFDSAPGLVVPQPMESTPSLAVSQPIPLEQLAVSDFRIRLEDYPEVPSRMRGLVASAPAEAGNLTRNEIPAFVAKRREEILSAAEMAQSEARRRGDHQAMRQINKLRKRSERMLHRLEGAHVRTESQAAKR